ncbi:PREDICTED: uncharacterized protein LOC106124567 isoform X3 [Papilio xuthus]|uniref:Uncharacterized protein LOC106124567 isoform X3 n=1 Tax=Papilio xuthus TaxID=66420 RepID=A0AAJ6ZPL9_PAPXU|nr:PREDICTED: uncharacterized protein LOC106124567 isoform X3 [Papilio xuthus]
MLFFNFLCLFYLMVLIDSHTISKSIAKDDEIINVVDSIHDLENDKEHDVKQNRFHIRNGYQEEPLNFHKSWTPKYTKLDTSLLASDTVNVTKYVQVTGKSNQAIVTKSHRKGFFERLLDRLKGKKKKQFISNDMMARIRIQSTAPRAQKHPLLLAEKRDNITKDIDKSYMLLKQRSKRKTRRCRLFKRQDDSVRKTARKVINYDSSNKSCTSTDIAPVVTDKLKKDKRRWLNDNYTWRNNFPFTTMRPSQQTFTHGEDLSLTELTTKIEHLKEIYNMKTDPYTNLMSVMLNPNGAYNFNKYTTPLAEEMDNKYMVETSEIEAILNNIKMNAIETITKGFVTELGIIPFSYRSTKSAKFKNNMKRNLNTSSNISNYVNVDELKKTLTKVKSQLCKEIKVSEGVIRNETKYWYNKLRGCSAHNAAPANKTSNRNIFIDYDMFRNSPMRYKKFSAINNTGSPRDVNDTSTQPPDDDDYDLITKSELLLKDLYQEHPMLFSTSKSGGQYSEHNTKSSRNEIVLTNLQRKTSEDAAGYGAAVDTSRQEEYENEVDNDKPLENMEINTQPANPLTTEFKDLAEKLYYNDYVNGYKHYLKFQQEQGVQNYSNLVRYQAHRHHSVDDIGKFILNKLPTVPKRDKRAFNDAAETTEDQDISTKSEESWFKKHFYVFIDSGQPKKYHSSQTVSLRPLVTTKNKFESSRSSSNVMSDNDNLIATTDQQRQSEDADLDQLANVLKMYKTQTTSAMEKVLKHGLKMGCESNNIAENVNTKLYDRDEKYDDKYDKNSTTEVNIDLLLESVLHRPVRNLHNDVPDNEYQLYRSYLPDLELDALKELSSERSRKLKKKSGKYAYVDLNVVTQPTAVVNLRNTGHDSKLRKFFNRLRFRFHKNKSNQKSILKKRDSPRTIKSLNPLKKLKKMFNVRIDGKPDVVLSKMFDYDMLDTHVNQFKSMKFNKPPPNLDDIKMDIPTVIPESSKLKSFTKDLPFKTTVPKKFFPHAGTAEKNDVPCSNETVMTEPCPILMTTKATPPPTSTIYRTLTGSARNRPDINDADFINIKVTTVKTLNDYTTPGMYDFAVSPYKAVRNKMNDINLIRRFTALVRPNKMAKENLQRVYLSSINSDDEIIDTSKFKHSEITHSRVLPTTQSHFFSYIQLNDDNQPYNIDNSSAVDDNVRQAQLVTMPLYEVSPRMKKHRLVSSKRRKYSNSRRRYQTTPNYLNDLEMWHNDILDSDKYTTWQNILKNIQQPYMYKPPDMMALKSELHRLDKLLDIRRPVGGEKLKSKIKQFDQATQINKTCPKKAETNEEFLIKKMEKSFGDENHKIKRRNIPSGEMQPLTRSEVRLEVPGLLSTQYRGILHPSFFVTHSVQIEDPAKSKSDQGNSNGKESATASDIMSFDTTLLAYDDSVNILKEVRDETTTKAPHHVLSPVNILTKLHKVPEQHFSTPLPMRNEDFENFLRDNNIDVKSVTSPVYFPSPEGFKTDLQAKGSVLSLDPIMYNQTTEGVHVLDPKNATQGTNRSTAATPKKKMGRYNNNELATEIENKYYHGFTADIKNNSNAKRMKRSIIKAPYRGLPSLDYLGAELFNKYIKLKPPLKNNSRQHSQSTESTGNFTAKTVDEDSEYFFDTLEDQLNFGKLDMTHDILNGPTIEDNEDSGNLQSQHLQEHNLKLTHKFIDVFPTENKIKINISELSKTFSEVIPINKMDDGRPRATTDKYKLSYSPLVHNNLLYHSKSDKKQEGIGKEKNTAADSYKQSKGNGDFIDQSDSKQSNKNYFDYDLYTNPKKVDVTTKSSKYDFILDEMTSNKIKDKRNGKHDISSQRLKVFGNSGFYSKNIQEFIKERGVEHRGPRRRRKRKRRQMIPDQESRVAEPRSAMDLMSGDRIRRIPSADGDRNEVTDSKTSQKTTMEPRRGTIIYDLKQLSRPRAITMKTRRGPFKKESTVTVSLKSSRSTTTAAPKITTLCKSPYTTKRGDKPTTPSTNATTTTEKPVKVTECTSGHTQPNVAKEKLTKTTTPVTTRTKLNPKQTFKTKTSDHRFVIITTKIFSKKIENKQYNDGLVTNALPLPTISMAKLSNENVTTAAAEVVKTKKSSCSTINSTLPSLKITVATSPTVPTLTSSTTTESPPKTSSTPFTTDDLKELDEESLYITSNYYDYHTADMDYNEDENKFDTTTKIRNNTTNKHLKRDIKSQNTFTAKDVAAIEVIVDLMRKNRNLNENEIVGAFNEIANKSTIAEQSTKATQAYMKSSDGISNSIQVHIAIPCNISIDKRRSLSEPVRIRKVFTARLSTPVDIEYQIHSVEDVDPVPTEAAFVIPAKNITCNTNTSDVPNANNLKNCTFTVINEITQRAEKLSPGLYVLVENQSIPDGQFILKPVDSKLLSDYKIKDNVMVTPKAITSANPNNLSKVTLSKDFIAVINKHLIELYQYLMTTKEHKRKLRRVDDVKLKRSATINRLRHRREINWDTIKKYIGHDKVCHCHCKPNRTMCRACAASDAVISELIFELDNLAQYMNDHCTEIQTYFWVNPSGGRKLRDAVHRIDKTLYDYFKRVSGKCKGRPCKVFMYMDKRDYVNPDNKSNYIGEPLIHDVEKLADHLEKALRFNIGDENLLDSGTKCLDVITKCMHLKSFNKRANEGETRRIKNVYSLDNVNVNIICKSDKLESTQKNLFDSTIASPPYLAASSGMFYYDDTGDYIKDEVKKKGIKSLLMLRGYPKKKRKDKSHWFPYNVTPSIGNIAKKNVKKRHVSNNYQIESPLNEEGIESKWYNFLKAKKYRDQLIDETTNVDDNFKYIANDNNTENATTTTVENSNKYDSFDPDDATVQSIDQYYSIAAYTLYKKVLSDVTHPKKRMKMNSIQPLKSKIKVSPSHPGINDFTPYNAIKPSSAKVRTIQNKKTTRMQNAATTKYHNKNLHANSRNITKDANLISVTNAVNNYEENLRKNLQKYSFSRLKESTINYLDASNSTRNLVSTATTPIPGHKQTTATNTITIRSSFTKKRPAMKSHKLNNKDDVTIRGPASSTNIPSTPKRNLVKVPLKNTLSKDELLFGGTTVNAVTKDNKELLLSILDFETNKLNEEWQRIALRKTAEDYVDDDAQSFIKLHSEVFMSNEKPQQHKEPDRKCDHKEVDRKEGKSVTALNMGHGVVPDKSPYNKHNHVEHKPQLVTKTTPAVKHHKPPASPATDTYYDIRKDLPAIELQPPPDAYHTKPSHGLLDKFLDKFKFKMLPGSKKEKVAKTHQNGPKGRALKRKLDHGKRGQSKATVENNSEAENNTNPATETTCPPESPCDNIEDKKVPQAPVNNTATSAAANAKNANKQPQHGPKMNENLKKTKSHGEAEVHEPSCVRGPLCDIDATIIHVIDMYKKLPAAAFRSFVKNITCYAYKELPQIFQIRDTTKTKKSRHGNEQGSKIWRWNWVRGKRSTENDDNFADISNRNDVDYDYIDDDNNNIVESKYPSEKIQYVLGNDKEDYDKLYLGTDGVYRGRENERRKRKTIDMTSVVNGLTNLPPLRELVDEIFVIRGKSISIFCNVSGTPVYSVSNLTNMFRYTWTAERKSMLNAPNLKVVGPSLVLSAIEPRNFGTYTCSQDKIVARSVRVNVIEIPDFNIVFTPLYKCLGECTYEDLENIQNLGVAIQKSSNCCGIVSSSARVDHPISLSDQQNEDLLKPTVVITAVAPAGIECGPECRRDLTCSIALLWASNAPALTTVKVVIIYDKFNNTLTPVDNNLPKMSISKKLKTKDSNGHREYQVLSRSMSPGDVDVVVACPAGYYLLTDQKICAVCPANTCAAAGENTCSPCPRGTHAEPGAAACRLGLSRLHRTQYFSHRGGSGGSEVRGGAPARGAGGSGVWLHVACCALAALALRRGV